MAIAPGSRINPALGKVNYGKQLQAELTTGPILTAARLKKSAETIKAANEQMAVYKQKQEERKLLNQGVAYVQRMAEKDDKATSQALGEYAFNPSNAQEVKEYFKISGGVKEGLESLQESVATIQSLYDEREQQRTLAGQIQGAVQGQGEQGTGTDTTSGPQLTPESQALMKLLNVMDPEDVDKYKDFIKFEDPVDPGTEKTYGEKYSAELARFQAETKDKGEQPFVVDFFNGTIKYNEKWKLGEDPLKPGDKEYEAFRKRYPTLIEELEVRKGLRFGADVQTEGTETPVATQEEIDRIKKQYGL
ncbi:MAG: hypothetical protein P8H35_00535 [Flavobacteriales bacterium]|nr:hypothetical protein [Flavobacteriales bacterium]